MCTCGTTNSKVFRAFSCVFFVCVFSFTCSFLWIFRRDSVHIFDLVCQRRNITSNTVVWFEMTSNK